MELFSKRYKQLGENIVESNVAVRLQKEIKYIIENGDYIERFLLLYDKNDKIFCLQDDSLKDLGMREIGYDITQNINTSSISFLGLFSDKQLFDLLELLIIFCKNDKREDFVNRIVRIFREENMPFVIHKWMLYKKDTTGLRSVLPFIKSNLLKNKLEEFYAVNNQNPNYQVMAQVGAGLLQMVFSSDKEQGDTKKYCENLCKEVALKWTDDKHVEVLADLLSTTVKNAKDLSNQIFNIRHTDQYAIPVDNPNFYKLVAWDCVAIVELAILSLPEKFISTDDPESMKNNYLSSYKLDKDTEWIIL